MFTAKGLMLFRANEHRPGTVNDPPPTIHRDSNQICRQDRSRSTIEITEIHCEDPWGIYALTRSPVLAFSAVYRSILQAHFRSRTSFLFLLNHFAILARILHLHSDVVNAVALPVRQSDVSSLVYAFRVAAAILLAMRRKILRLAGCRFLAALPSCGSVSIFLRVTRATIIIRTD